MTLPVPIIITSIMFSTQDNEKNDACKQCQQNCHTPQGNSLLFCGCLYRTIYGRRCTESDRVFLYGIDSRFIPFVCGVRQEQALCTVGIIRDIRRICAVRTA